MTGWRLFLKTIVARAYPRVIGHAAREVLDVLRRVPADAERVCVCVRVPSHRRAGGICRLCGGRRRDDLLLDERAVEHVQPVVLGEGAGQPGAVYHCAELDDGDPARHGGRRAVRDGAAGAGDHDRWVGHVPGAILGRQFYAAHSGLPAGDDRAVRHGHDERVAVPAAQPRGMAHLEPGTGAGLPGLGVLLPDQVVQFLGRRGGFDHTAHAGTGCDAPAGLPPARCSVS
ncbi:MAG: hypothetical protein MZV64_00035 [Ignavibacteriales bacterium]|nr:hypothetical protein [Ignavibacteriales bacterium]